ncbi:MAG: xanthine dehydrogenase family protein subunit M [Kosmotoga sp.]|nr:MAG: xanthine dehydrogenase family protein subunit M [Kosmotoga sp.]
MNDFILLRPTGISEAIEMLDKYGSKAALKAGGTDLIIWMKKFLVKPDYLIDLTLIDELKSLQISNKELTIGAMVSVNQLMKYNIVKTKFKALYDACRLHSDPIIRNKATVVGNLCSAVPSGDLIPPLYCYDALVNIESVEGKRKVTINDFIKGPKTTSLKPNELVTGITIPIPEGSTSGCFLKIGRRRALDIAQAGVCCTLTNEPSKKYHLSFCAVSPKPVRALEAEKILNNASKIDDALLDKVSESIVNVINPISDARASKEYRTEMIKQLTKRAILKCNYPDFERGGTM